MPKVHSLTHSQSRPVLSSHIALQKGEQSPLAELGAKLL